MTNVTSVTLDSFFVWRQDCRCRKRYRLSADLYTDRTQIFKRGLCLRIGLNQGVGQKHSENFLVLYRLNLLFPNIFQPVGCYYGKSESK